jgi:hypothetical protein
LLVFACCKYSVPDIAEVALYVQRRRGREVADVLWRR